jgi:hypothetical protein
VNRPSETHAVPTELNVLALVKGSERYIFVYDDQSQDALVNVFRDQAADPRLSLSWFDATVLTRKALEQAESQPEAATQRETPGESPAPERIRETP